MYLSISRGDRDDDEEGMTITRARFPRARLLGFIPIPIHRPSSKSSDLQEDREHRKRCAAARLTAVLETARSRAGGGE
jgi:hypothetical protein